MIWLTIINWVSLVTETSWAMTSACWSYTCYKIIRPTVLMHTIPLFRPRRSRSAAAYSHQTFPWTICRSVCRSVQCIVEKRLIGSGCTVGRTGPGMRQVVGFGDRSTVRGTFGGEFGARHGPRGPTGRTCATAPRRGPLAKLFWADLFLDLLIIVFVIRVVIHWSCSTQKLI